MLNSITFTARPNRKSNKIKLDKAKIEAYTTRVAAGVDAGVGISIYYDKFIKQGENIIDKKITEQDIINKIAEICYQGVEEPEYARQESEPDEYYVSLNRFYYDRDGRLRKKTSELNCGILEFVELYNENGNIVYYANVCTPQNNCTNSIERVFYDGSKKENITSFEESVLDRKNLETKIISTNIPSNYFRD